MPATPPTDVSPVAARRAELALEAEWLDVEEAFLTAKASRHTSPDAEAVYQAAKARMSEMRRYWRQIGEAVGTRTPSAASVVTINAEES